MKIFKRPLRERLDRIVTLVEELQASVAELVTEDEATKTAVAAAAEKLKQLEEKITNFEAAGTITPEQAAEIKAHIDGVASDLKTSTETLSKA